MVAMVRARAAPMVLVVEDEREIRETVADILVQAGYRVSTAPNGHVALERARVNRPDLIFLDLMMPVMSGWEFLEAQREDPDLATVPVIAASAGLDSSAEGAAVFLRKPFDLDTLLVAASRLCSVSEQLDEIHA